MNSSSMKLSRRLAIALCLTSLAIPLAHAVDTAEPVKKPKYIFLFIGDGMSTPQRMVAEEFARVTGYGELAMNTLPYQANTRTKSANSIITDSAAAATAIASGEKTNNGMLGILPDGTPVVSVAEIAKKRGMKVGIASTVTVVHATPAGFYAHRKNRGEVYAIALDLVASGFDYFCAGGVYDEENDVKNPAYEGNVYDLARKAGYRVVRDDLAAWRALRPGAKVWSVFGDCGMDFAIDANPNQPSPAEIVRKGIELLDNPEGFFFMFEGGRVDYAGHANDAGSNLRDVLALDEAVKVALMFLDQHPDETLVITTGDHETGGMSMGFAGIGGRFKVQLLAGQKVSIEKFSDEVKRLLKKREGKVSFEEMKPVLVEKFGLSELTEAEEKSLSKAFAQDVENVRNRLKDTTAHDVARRYAFAQTVKMVLNARAGIGWSSGSHTALPTFTTAKGVGAEILLGMTENTDLGRRMKGLLEK